MRKALLGYTAVLLSALCFGTAAIIIKIAYMLGLSPWQIMLLQYIIASCLLLLGGAIFYRQIFKVSKKQLIPLSLEGLFGFSTWACFYLALQQITAAQSAILLYTYPILVALGTVVFFREKIKFTYLLALGMTVLGTTLASGLTWQDIVSIKGLGIFWGLGAALSYALFNIYGQYILKDIKPWTVTFYVQVLSTLLLIIFRLPDVIALGNTHFKGLVITFLLATACTIIPFYLLLIGIRYIGAKKTSIISTFELPTTILLAYLILREPFFWLQVIGGVLIFTSIIILVLSQESDNPIHDFSAKTPLKIGDFGIIKKELIGLKANYPENRR